MWAKWCRWCIWVMWVKWSKWSMWVRVKLVKWIMWVKWSNWVKWSKCVWWSKLAKCVKWSKCVCGLCGLSGLMGGGISGLVGLSGLGWLSGFNHVAKSCMIYFCKNYETDTLSSCVVVVVFKTSLLFIQEQCIHTCTYIPPKRAGRLLLCSIECPKPGVRRPHPGTTHSTLCSIWGFGVVYRRGLWFTPLCYLYNDMAYVMSDYSLHL